MKDQSKKVDKEKKGRIDVKKGNTADRYKPSTNFPMYLSPNYSGNATSFSNSEDTMTFPQEVQPKVKTEVKTEVKTDPIQHARAGRAAAHMVVGERPPTPCLYVSSPAVNNQNRFVSIKLYSSCFIIAYYRHLAESAINYEAGCDETRPLLDKDGRPAGNIFLLRHWQTLSLMRQDQEVISHLGFDGSPFRVHEAIDPEPSMN